MLKVKVFDSNDEYNQVDDTFGRLLKIGITVCGLDTETTIVLPYKDSGGAEEVPKILRKEMTTNTASPIETRNRNIYDLLQNDKTPKLVSILQICIQRNSNN